MLVFVDEALGKLWGLFYFLSGDPTGNKRECSHCLALVLGRAKTIPDKGLLLQQSTSNEHPRFALKAFCHGNALASEG